MNEVTLVLARHGNTFESEQTPRWVGANTDLNLTEFGRQQAQKVANYLENNKLLPQFIYCGPLQRQLETASLISKQISLSAQNIKTVSALVEIDYGVWENLTTEEIVKKWPNLFMAWTQNGTWPSNIFPQKEEQFVAAIEAWISSLLEQDDYSRVLAVTSNGTLRYIYKLCSEHAELKSAHEIKVRTGGVCVVKLTAKTREIVCWNEKP